MEAVKLPLSATMLLPTYALAEFDKWARLFASWMESSSFDTQLRLEAARKNVERIEQQLTKEISSGDDNYVDRYMRIRREVNHISYGGMYQNHYFPTPTREERYERALREAKLKLAKLEKTIEDEKRAGDEVSKYMSWWDWFNSLDMEGMKEEIIRLEGPKKGRQAIEGMLL